MDSPSHRDATFAHASYAAVRPTYPAKLYDILLSYHEGPRRLAIDLGTGHGLVARAVAPHFTRVLATDPSAGMLAQARALSTGFPNIEFESAAAENLASVASGAADMVVSGQAAHWFDHALWWVEMRRVVRPGGTVAIWAYKDPVIIGFPGATRVLAEYAYGSGDMMMGDYWSQPGRSIVEGKLQDIVPPKGEWRDVRRIEYEPSVEGKSKGEGELLMERPIKIREMMEYIRTWSAAHNWREAHPEHKKRAEGGKGDVIDETFDKMRDAEDEWTKDEDWMEKSLDLEWGTGLLIARKVYMNKERPGST